MARRQVTDKDGKQIGTIDDQPKQAIVYDLAGKRVGRFDKNQNVTFDAGGAEYGKGDLIKKLLAR